MEDLQTNRNVPVACSTSWSNTPEGIYLTSIRQTGKRDGDRRGQTNERRPKFLDNAPEPGWLHKPGWSRSAWSRPRRRRATAASNVDATSVEAVADPTGGANLRRPRGLGAWQGGLTTKASAWPIPPARHASKASAQFAA